MIPGSTYGFVASTNRDYPAVAFVAPGPSNSQRLYVGTDEVLSSQIQYYLRKYTCGLSSRYLSGDRIFQTPAADRDGFGTFAYHSLEAATSGAFLVKYVTGFSVSGYSYFVTTQPTATVSKLSQVCQNDPRFDSYVEMQINCQSDSKNYNLVQAATLLQPGSRLATSLNITDTEHLLVAAFYSEPDSALCVYQLSEIRR